MKPRAHSLGRFLSPRSIAIVGASERLVFSNNAMAALGDAPFELYLVNPGRAMAYGRPTYPSISAIGRPVDAVLSLVNAEASTQLVEEAAGCDVGGVVVTAGGFAEATDAGRVLQERLRVAAATAGLPVCGPNCTGFINVRTGAHLANGPRQAVRAGRIGVVSSSGAMLFPIMGAAVERFAGLSSLISVGNEAVTDLVDYLEFLIDDPDTAAIGLVIEGLRRPREFLAAADRARTSGKPVVALKLGRTAQARRIAESHTAAIVGDSRLYDFAFRQVGINLAVDVDDLLDRLAFFDQLPASRWVPVRGAAILSASGGAAVLASDLGAEEGLPIPPLTHLSETIAELIPGLAACNPLDLTGFAVTRPEIIATVLERYAREPELDTLVLLGSFKENEESWSAPTIEPFVSAALASDKAFVLASREQQHFGTWALRFPEHGIGLGRGLRPTIRGLATMAGFAQARRGHQAGFLTSRPRTTNVAPLEPPSQTELFEMENGCMLSFGRTMALLKNFGIPVAPWTLVSLDATIHPEALEFPGPYALKLANVAHRTELGAVRTSVDAADLQPSIDELRAVARTHAISPEIVIQPMLPAIGECFAGVDNSTHLGPLVVCGLGGVLVEVMGRVSGRLAPVTSEEVADMLRELGAYPFAKGFRGSPAWNHEQITRIMMALGQLAVRGASWIGSLDINPLLYGPGGFVAVDALCVVKPDASETQ